MPRSLRGRRARNLQGKEELDVGKVRKVSSNIMS